MTFSRIQFYCLKSSGVFTCKFKFEKERIYTVEIFNSGIPSEVTYFTFTFIAQCCLFDST